MEKLVQTFIAAGVVVKQDGKYLMVQENAPGEPFNGLWNIPAGRVAEGDTIEKTAVKEAREESGYEVELIRKLDIFQANEKTPPKHIFEAKIIGGQFEWDKDEISEVKWFTWEEINNMKDKLRSDWVLGAIRIVEEGK